MFTTLELPSERNKFKSSKASQTQALPSLPLLLEGSRPSPKLSSHPEGSGG